MTTHNPYFMPFLMSADAFAVRAVKAIQRGDRFRVFPWQMGVVAMLLRWLPRFAYDALFVRSPRKPRVAPEDVAPLGHTVGLSAEDHSRDRLGPETFPQRELDLGLPVVPLSLAASHAASAAAHDPNASTIRLWRSRPGWNTPD
jgi:hypothetical protein